MALTADCTVPADRARGLRAAVTALRRGEIVLLPVDTMYALVVDPFAAVGVQALRLLKGRGRDLPLSVCVAGSRTVEGLLHNISPQARDLMESFWPGPLTLVGTATPSLAWDLGDTRGTVAVRMPLHPIALEVLTAFGPLAVTAAARAGLPTVASAAAGLEEFGDGVAVYLEAGHLPPQQPSAVIDVTVTPPQLLRGGGYPESELLDVCPDLVIDKADTY